MLARFETAARAENADIIMRITADCLFIDPHVSGAVLSRLIRADADYVATTFPQSGRTDWIGEVFKAEALYAAANDAERALDREHVTPFIKHNRDRFKVLSIGSLALG